MKRKFSIKVMCHDPSMTAWGWAIMSPKGKVYTHGCIKTEPSPAKLNIRKGDDRIRRINELNTVLRTAIQIHEPLLHLVELPHGSQSAVGAFMVGSVAGVIQTISHWTSVSAEYYSEADAKKAVSGKRSLTKDEMVERIGRLYSVDWTGIKYYDEAVADAIAIFHCASKQSEILRFLIK